MKMIWTRDQTYINAIRVIASSRYNDIADSLELLVQRIGQPFPLLIFSSGMICREVFEYLYDFAVMGSSKSPKSLATYAESLKHWLTYAEVSGINWRSPTKRHFTQYRNAMLGQPANGARQAAKQLSKRTVNLRLTVAIEFSKFLHQEKDAAAGLASNPIEVAGNNPEIAGRTAHFQLKPAHLHVRAPKSRPRALTVEASNGLVCALSLPHSLAFQWQLCTGLRRGSVIALSLGHIDELSGRHSDGTIEVPAKGGKLASVYVPRNLLDATLRYIETDRRLINPTSRSRQSTSRSSLPLFLNCRGRPLTGPCYYKAFKRACRRIGLNAKTHHARSTFATHMENRLGIMRANGMSIDPIKIVQGLLGHADSETTAIYLESISCNSADILRAIEDFSSTMVIDSAS